MSAKKQNRKEVAGKLKRLEKHLAAAEQLLEEVLGFDAPVGRRASAALEHLKDEADLDALIEVRNQIEDARCEVTGQK